VFASAKPHAAGTREETLPVYPRLMRPSVLLVSAMRTNVCDYPEQEACTRQNIQCQVGFAMMSPSAILFLLRIVGRKGSCRVCHESCVNHFDSMGYELR